MYSNKVHPLIDFPNYYWNIIKDNGYPIKEARWHPTNHRFTCAPDYVIAIPVCKEEKNIIVTLRALNKAMQKAKGEGRVLLLINNHFEETKQKALAYGQREKIALEILEIGFIKEQTFATYARMLALDLAASLLHPRGILITTNADSQPNEDFILAHLEAINSGAALSCGTIKFNINRPFSTLFFKEKEQENLYRALIAYFHHLLLPDPFNPWPHHTHQSSANLAIALYAYERIQGFAREDQEEERLLIEHAHIYDLPIVYNNKAKVIFNEGEQESIIYEKYQESDSLVKERDFSHSVPLEKAEQAIKRTYIKAALKNTWEAKEDYIYLLKDLGLDEMQIGKACRFYNFGAFWHYIEQTSPHLARSPFKLEEIEDEIKHIQGVIAQKRMQQQKIEHENSLKKKHALQLKPRFS